MLVKQLECQLQCPRTVVLVAVLGHRDVAEVRGGEVQLARLSEGRRVGGVESFGAELQARRLSKCEVLEDR